MAVFNGNRVAYGNGGHWYVQVVVTDEGGNTSPATNVYYTYNIIFENSVVDSVNTINWSDPWGSGERNNYPFNGAGTYTISGTHKNAATISYGVQNRLHFRFYATGMAGGGTGPSVVEFDYYLPGRTGTVPDPPRRLLVWDIHATDAFVATLEAGAENGYPADVVNYRVHRQHDGAHMGDIHGPYSGVRFGGLARVTNYVAFAQVHNAAGWGGWSAGYVFTTSATVPGTPGPPRFSDLRATSVTVDWDDPDNGGSPITERGYQYSLDPNFTNAPHIALAANGVVTRNDLIPGREYFWRAHFRNAVGLSAYSPTASIKTQAGGWISVNGVYRLAIPYVNDANGIPRLAVPYINDASGNPKPVSG